MSKQRQLTVQMRQEIIDMFAQGYTIRHIKRYMVKQMGHEPSDAQLMRVTQLYAIDIEKAREDIAQMALTRGLASRSNRLLRLNLLAEDWEERASVDPKAARIYLSTLDQVREEVEDLHTPDMENDPWVKLLNELKDLSKTPRLEAPPVPTPAPVPAPAQVVGTQDTVGTPPQPAK